jgi:hypothetical protein
MMDERAYHDWTRRSVIRMVDDFNTLPLLTPSAARQFQEWRRNSDHDRTFARIEEIPAGQGSSRFQARW